MIKDDYSEQVTLNPEEQGNFILSIPVRYDVEDMNLTDLMDQFEWQITYKFTDEIRGNVFQNGKYGADNMTFRRLYVILCERFNEGDYFIETYLRDVYPYRPVKEEADEFLNEVNNEIMSEYMSYINEAIEKDALTKTGKLDKRYKAYKKLSSYKVMADEEVRVAGELLAESVAMDIKRCLPTGIIPLNKDFLEASTQEKRLRVGLPSNIVFFASGQLIDNVQVYFRLEKKNEWLNQYL